MCRHIGHIDYRKFSLKSIEIVLIDCPFSLNTSTQSHLPHNVRPLWDERCARLYVIDAVSIDRCNSSVEFAYLMCGGAHREGWRWTVKNWTTKGDSTFAEGTSVKYCAQVGRIWPVSYLITTFPECFLPSIDAIALPAGKPCLLATEMSISLVFMQPLTRPSLWRLPWLLIWRVIAPPVKSYSVLIL